MQNSAIKNQNEIFDVYKALLIILVVCGHKGLFLFEILPIYSFHMPAFVFASGYFYKESNHINYIEYIFKKVKKLIVPYFLWNIFYGALISILLFFGIVKYGQYISFETLFLSPWFEGQQYVYNSPAWFVCFLFLVYFIYVFIRCIYIYISKSEFFLLLVLFCISFGLLNSEINMAITRSFFGIFFFQLGYVYKRYLEIYDESISLEKKVFFIICVGTIISSIYSYNDIAYLLFNMGNVHWYAYITSAIGIYLCLILSKAICNMPIRNGVLIFIGNNTWSIMMHHVFGFFVLNIFYLIIYIPNFDYGTFQTHGYYTYMPFGYLNLLIYICFGVYFSIYFPKVIHKLISYIIPKKM